MSTKIEGKVKNILINLKPQVPLYYGMDITEELMLYLKMLTFDKFFLISEENIFNIHGRRLLQLIKESNLNCEAIFISDLEEDKNFRSVEKLCNELIKRQVSKDSILIGFGGGVTGNITGLTASLVYRGIRFIEVPTTLIGQSDSALSNKQAVNGETGKNQFGVYYAPEFIWADLRYVFTQSFLHIKSAIVEGIKNAFVSDKNLLKDFEIILLNKKMFSDSEILKIYELLIKSKNAILEKDPAEKSYAVILEYGHTFGHAIEFLSKGKIIHGQAVGLGMCIAAELGFLMGTIDKECLDLHYYFIKDVLKLNLKLPESLNPETLFKTIEHDNKRTFQGLKYIILNNTGRCMSVNGDCKISISKEKVMHAINAFLNKNLGLTVN